MAGGTLGLPSGIPSDSILDLTRSFEVGETGISGKPVSISSYSPLIRRINTELVRAEPHIMVQREQMADAWKFYTGHQLTDEDLRVLKAARRPDTAINEIEKFIKFAAGIERRTQQALLYAARTIEDQQAQTKGELCTKSYEWFCDQSSASYERSRAFESKLVCGIGITDTGLTRNIDPSGGPRYGFCDASDFWWPECSKENFGLDSSSPVKWLAREMHWDVGEAVRKWPDSSIYIVAAGGQGNEDQFPSWGRGAHRPINYVVPWIQTEPLNKSGGEEGKPGKVKILEWQEYADEAGYYFFDPIQKDDTWLNKSDFRKLRNRYQVLYGQDGSITDYDAQDHRVYYRTFLLNRRIMLQEPEPLTNLTHDIGYTWNVMTGSWDRQDKVWFGILRGFMAPQRYANAMFRQVLEILGAAHKGGAFAEVGAMTIAQKRDYEERGAVPGSINMVQPGAISGNKIQPKPIPVLPQGTMEVLNFCIEIMEKMSGISMSLLSTPTSNTPGVSLRRQLTAGMVLLAAEFDALSRFRKREGRLIFEFMRLIADDRIIRIGGAFDGQAIQLTKDPFALKYDIVLDEIEQDPNMRQYYTDQVMTIAPILVRTGNFVPELLDYVNIPVQFRQALKKGIEENAKRQQEMAMQGISPGGRGKPRGLEEIKADVQLKQARAGEHQAKALEHIAKARAIPEQHRQAHIKNVGDLMMRGHELRQGERQLNIDLLGKLFDALKPPPGNSGASKR